MKAFIFMVPPQAGQSRGSNSNTFFMQRAQEAEGLGAGSSSGCPGLPRASLLKKGRGLKRFPFKGIKDL